MPLSHPVGLNKVGCPTLWGHPRSWKAKHKEPVGGGMGWSSGLCSKEELGGPTITNSLAGSFPAPQQEVPRGRNRVRR